MSIEGIGVGLLLAVILGLWIGLPLTRREKLTDASAIMHDRQSEYLLMLYEQTLRNIRDLDEDHATGKINPDEYAHEREGWAQRGVALLKALDSLNTDGIIAGTSSKENVDDAIEAAVAAYRTKTD